MREKHKKGKISYKNNNSGITLVALVVTIVVLIILATISINAIFGEDGIIKRAEEAKDAHLRGEQNDLDALESLDTQIADLIGGNKTEEETKITAYALVLDNSADSDNAVPMIFVKTDKKVAVGDTYESKTYGALPVAEVYTDFENTYYEAGNLSPEWDNSANNVTSVVFEDEINPISTARWFAGMELKNIDIAKLNTSNTTNMEYMFYGFNVESNALDLSTLKTSTVTNMNGMFSYCKLTSIDLSNFNTSNVTDMGSMFSNSKFTSLDLKNFITSKVTDMKGMFLSCRNLTSLEIGSSFDTGNVLSMYQMFAYCTSLTDLDVSGFNTGNVLDMYEMFA